MPGQHCVAEAPGHEAPDVPRLRVDGGEGCHADAGHGLEPQDGCLVLALPAAEPHLPMMMGMVFSRVRERLAAEAPELRPSQLRVLE